MRLLIVTAMRSVLFVFHGYFTTDRNNISIITSLSFMAIMTLIFAKCLFAGEVAEQQITGETNIPISIVNKIKQCVKCSDGANLAAEDDNNIYFIKYAKKHFILHKKITKSKYDIKSLDYIEACPGIRLGNGEFLLIGANAKWNVKGFVVENIK